MEICLLGLLIWCFHLETLCAIGIFQHQRSAPPKARTPKMKEWMPSSSSSLASAFTWVPTPNLDKADPEGSEAAVAFLYSGDVLSLSQANCTRRFEVRDMGKASSPPPALRSYLRGATDTLTHATNFLNMVFQTNDIRESSVKEDVEWYHALVRSVMDGDSQVYRAMLTFDAHPVSSKPQMMLQATKENNEILLQDLSPSAESLRNLTWENEWYNFFRFQRAPFLYKRILSNDLKTLDTPKWSQGDSYVMDTSHIKWSPPFLECEDGKFLSTWMVTLSSSFYGLKPDLNPEFKGVLRMDVKIQNIDINQCAGGQGWFANTHRCDLNSTQCVPQENQGFVLGKYICICKPGFYGTSRAASSSSSPASTNKDPSGGRASQYGTMDSGNMLECRPCQEGCTTCTDGTPCLIQEDWSLRAAVLAFQAFCMLAVFFSMLVSYHFRKSKRIRASGVLLLETILFGSLLLYFPVFILYFKPSIFRCIVLRWVRMLGFAIVYGTITLKLYRVLKIFLSRTAQRVPYMSSGRVLKMLALILLLVLWFLAAWTVGMLENIEKNIPLVVRSKTTRGLQFYICDHDRWDYMMVVAEMLFLFWGSFLCYATRTVPSAFHEPRYMGIALHNELITSAAFHVVRFLMVPSLHPDWTLLLFFIHTHITTTMTLALLFIPKFLHAGSPLREEIAAEVYEDELDIRRSGSYLNSSITSAWSEHSLDPDDIRDELKKLYTQLEVHKTKKMTANNPHLQKKRSSKRGLGRSLMRRITEIPESVSRQCSKEEKDGSVGGGTGSHTGSYKRRHLDTGSSSVKLRDDSSSKHKVGSSLKKSHSTYDHTRDAKENSLPSRHNSCKEAPLLDSMMRKKLAKKASERSNSDSLDDSAPLVYKSASAHNLMAERKPLHPKPSPLQKSLSVVTSAKEKALLLTSRAYLEESSKLARDKERKAAVEDSTTESEVSGHTEVTDIASEVAVKQLQMDDTSEGTVSSLLEDAHDSKDIACPWESATAPSTPSESRSQKHVTYSPIRSVSINTSELTGRRHHASKKIPPEPPIRQQSLTHSLEKKEVVPCDVGDQTQPSSQSPKTDPKDSPILTDSPRETEEYPEKTKMERTRQAENSVPISSSAGLTRLASIAAEVCPWEVMEIPLPKKKDLDTSDSESQKSSPEKQSQSPQASIPKSSMKSLSLAIKAFNRSRIKTAIKARKDSEENQIKSERDMDGKPEKLKLAEASLTPAGGSPGQQVISKSTKAKIVSKQATICPWDEEEEDEELLSSQKHSPSKTPEVCPWEESPDGLAQGRTSSAEAMASKIAREIASIRLERTKSQRESVCPWETIDEDQKRENKTSDISLEIIKTDDKIAEACPWEVEEVRASTRSDTQSWGIISALPQDEIIKEGKVEPSHGYKRERSSTKAHSNETQEKSSTQPDSKNIKELSLGKEFKKSSEVSNIDENKFRSIESSKTFHPESEFRVKTQICPWEVEEPPSEKKVPGEDSTGSSKEEKRTVPKAAAAKNYQEDSICPWETMELPGRTNTKTATTERESSKANVKATICPWETNDTPLEKLKEDSKEDSRDAEGKKLKSLLSEESKDRSHRGSVCPWENAGVEDSSTKPAVKIPELSKAVLKASSSGDSKKMENCPWKTEAAEVCPWEVASPTLRKGTKQVEGGPSKSMPPELSKAILKASSSGDSKKVEVCPWETETVEVCPWEVTSPTLEKRTKQVEGGPSKSMTPELSKVVLKASSSGDSKKMEVCPWETETAEVCPWEVASPTLEKEKKQVEGGPSKGIPMRASHPLKTPEDSIRQDSVCPWENTESEDALLKPSSQPLHLSDIHLKKPSSFQSKKAEIAPWEMQEETDIKATICPWENDDTLTLKRGLKKDVNAQSKEEKKEVIAAAPEKESNGKSKSVCPWERTGSEDSFIKPKLQSIYLSQGRSKKSDSVESQRSAVCPWETEDTEVSTKTAEICPWEVIPAPSATKPTRETDGATKKTGDTVAKAPEKVSSTGESVCPWETMDISGLSAKSPGLSKVSSKKSSSTDSLKADVCPWESQEAEPSSKADVCPWEVSESPVSKKPLLTAVGTLENHRKPLLKPTDSSKTMERMTSPQEPVCPWDSVSEPTAKPELSKTFSKKSDSAESLKAEVCPWEVEASVLKRDDYGRSSKREDSRSSSPMSISEAMEKLSRSREDICPWESMELEEPLARSAGQSPALSKAGSKKSDSAESLRAEVCPWEVMEEEEMTPKVDICPWTAATAPFEKGNMRQSPVEASKGKKGQMPLRSPDSKKAEQETSFKKIEKSKSQQEPVFIWKSMEFDKPPAKSTRSLDLLQVSSKKSESVESLKAEVCPWEFQELPTETKAGICPRTAAEGPSERDSLNMDKGMVSRKETSTIRMIKTLKTEEKVSGSPESVCPWESMELPSSPSPTLSKAGSKKSDSTESLRAEVCPWEFEEEECLTTAAPVDEGLLRKKTSKGKISPDLIKAGGETLPKKVEKTRSHPGLTYAQKNSEELSVKPMSKSLDLLTADSVKSDSVESLKTEICPWETQSITAIKKSDVCLWEAAGAPLVKGALSKDRAGISTGATKMGTTSPGKTFKAPEKTSSPRESICPWDSSAAAEISETSPSASTSLKKSDSTESRKAEVCPWETKQPESSPKEEICPWEVETMMPTKDDGHTTHAGRTEMPTVSMKSYQSKQEGLSGHKPLCRSLPDTTPPRGLSKESSLLMGVSSKSRSESTTAGVCTWEAEERPSSTRKETVEIVKTFSEVCPWEAKGISTMSGSPAKTKTEKSQTDKAEGPNKAKSDICPWDSD